MPAPVPAPSRLRQVRAPDAVSAMQPRTSAAATSISPKGPSVAMPCAATCAPAIAPSVPPIATSGNSRSPSASLSRSFASDQNWAMLIVLKMPSQTKNAKPTSAPARPSPTKASSEATKNRKT